MPYQIGYVRNPNMLIIFMGCLLGDVHFFGMKSSEAISQRVPYHSVFRKWFDFGVTEISVNQIPFVLEVSLTKKPEEKWDDVLSRITSSEPDWFEVKPRLQLMPA